MKISFGVKSQPKTAVVQNPTSTFSQLHQHASDSEDNDEEQEVKKRGINLFENGAAALGDEENKPKLVIPMVKKTDWKTQRQIEMLKKQEEEGTITEENKARLALLRESIGEAEETEESTQNGTIETAAAAGENAEDADYSKMPIDGFGLAMLRGMGWKDGEGMGKQKVKVDYKPPMPRPKGLGLGAVPKVKNNTSVAKNGDKGTKDKQLGVGSLVKIVGTSNNGKYGKVEGVDEENASVFVNLVLVKNTVRVSQYAVQLVSKEEYEKDSKCINKKAYDSARTDTECDKKTSRPSSSSSSPTTEWVQRSLRVRFIDKKYEDRRYYKTKMVVLDAPDSRHCTLEDEDGRKHYDIRESWLETIIPRKEGSKVMIVGGKRRGKLAVLEERDVDRERIKVRVLGTDEVVKLSFDDACEYVGRS
ncbi:hypothetical protein QR680_012019 [Steinernema hermaphroditum]|uniref:G-patch domain-containing protein n=1 Tax=Steinernema hermaphroditum TaxID=289476 RepID=A0AA39M013_9BILA|nr:hypothetical protein QR680_012019 [Steinernema hermaphroditum]